MRDGVHLSADVYHPRGAGETPNSRVPTVLIRTPYNNASNDNIRKGRTLADSGYACVIQDVRGRWDSDGPWSPFVTEPEDGYDTQAWIAEQPWSNGRIGMSGRSYLGSVQWLSAPLAHPSLACLAPQSICVDYLTGLVRPGGAFQLGVLVNWGLRVAGRTAQSIDFENWTEICRVLPLEDIPRFAGRDLDFWRDWLHLPATDPYWASIDTRPHWNDITVPAFVMGGWYDLYAPQAFDQFNGLRLHGGSAAARQSRLIMGPWPHHLGSDLPTAPRTGDIDFGAAAVVNMNALERTWFDRWLKGNGDALADEPPLRLFVMGVNQWRDEHEWPLARTDWQPWHLHSEGVANSVRGDGVLSLEQPGDEPADTYAYDPNFPVQSCGGANCCTPHIEPWGPYDQRPVEARNDVLCYTSAPLEQDLEVIGPIKLVLHAATDGLDTDWTAKLVDVSPTGYAMNLCDGILRARYRHGQDQPCLLDAGSRRGLRDRSRRHRQRLQARPPHSPRSLLVQLPPLRPQPEHRRRPGHRCRNPRRPPNSPARPRPPLAPDPAGHPYRLTGGPRPVVPSLGGAEQCPQSAFRRLDRRWPMRRLPALQPGLRQHGHNRRIAPNRAARHQLFQRR